MERPARTGWVCDGLFKLSILINRVEVLHTVSTLAPCSPFDLGLGGGVSLFFSSRPVGFPFGPLVDRIQRVSSVAAPSCRGQDTTGPRQVRTRWGKEGKWGLHKGFFLLPPPVRQLPLAFFSQPTAQKPPSKPNLGRSLHGHTHSR